MSSEAPNVPEELSANVSKLVELNKQITEAKADIKVLTSAERKIKDSIKRLMVTQGIDTINLRQGKISLSTTTRKGTMTKVVIKSGINAYFAGDPVKIEGLMNAIQDQIKEKRTTSLRITGLKEKAPKKEETN
tara:strand:+ start:14 stop:412 length:399 start_codon:yes stop_codon:yes gene_type:complete